MDLATSERKKIRVFCWANRYNGNAVLERGHKLMAFDGRLAVVESPNGMKTMAYVP